MINKKFRIYKAHVEKKNENINLAALADYLYLLYLSEPVVCHRCIKLLRELKMQEVAVAQQSDAKAKSSDKGATGSGAPASQEKKKGPEGQQD